jgi:hypothetical protein
MGWECSAQGDEEIVVGKREGKRTLGKHRPRREENSKMDVWEICSEGVSWIHLAHDRDRWKALVNMIMNLLVP